MERLLYYVVTLVESLLAVFGIRGLSEQPSYAVERPLDRGVEIRRYEARQAVETDAAGAGDGEAFGRLFRYITGANDGGRRIAMTAPVESGRATSGGSLIAMTTPVEQGDGGRTMRFVIPATVAAAGAPAPTEAGVRLVAVPPRRLAILRFSGAPGAQERAGQEAILRQVLAAAGIEPAGPAIFFGYDPPFAIPFLRRNEVALPLNDSG